MTGRPGGTLGEVLGKLGLHRVTPGLTIGLPTITPGVPRLSPESPQFYPEYPQSYLQVYPGTFQVSPCYPKVALDFQYISPESSKSSQGLPDCPQLTKGSYRSLQGLLLVSQCYSQGLPLVSLKPPRSPNVIPLKSTQILSRSY